MLSYKRPGLPVSSNRSTSDRLSKLCRNCLNLDTQYRPSRGQSHGSSLKTSVKQPVRHKHSSPLKRQAHTCEATQDDEAQPSPSEISSYNAELRARVFPFLIPVSIVVLSEPLLSLCTSMFVGTYGTTLELAALGPASIIISFMQYIFYSLQVATLALCAVALRDNNLVQAQRVLSCSIFIALTWGAGAAFLMYCCPLQLITLTGIKDLSILQPAADFLRVRALGQPAVLMLMVTQAAMLAQQDAVVPGFVISTATALSIAGHFILVKGMGWGLMGAAYSTTTANIVGALALLIASEMRGKLKPRVQVPTKEDIASMTSTVAPLSVTYMSKNACYMLIQTAAASTLTVMQLAAHQAIFAVWTFANYLISPVEQAALTFIPAAQKRWQMLETGKLVMTLGPLVGLIGGCFVYATTMFSPQLFSADPTLYPFMCLTSGWALVSLIFSGVDISANGMTIALGDSAYVAKSLVLTLGCIFIFTSLCRYYLWGLEGIWIGIMVFFLVRAKRSSYRIFLEFRAPPVAPKEAPGPETAAGTA